MIWMSGLDMGCFYFNRAWLEFVGRTLEQEAGNGWAEGVHPDDLQRCVNHYVSCFERRQAFAMSYRLRHRSGQYRWILDRGAPHLLPSGEFLGYYGGCAELGEADVLARHADLGSSLQRIRAFARSLADESTGPLRGGGDEPLELAVRRIAVDHEADRRKIETAGGNLRKLAQDMMAFDKISQGACLTDERAS